MNINIKDLHKSKTFQGIIVGIVSIVILLLAFQLGVFVGYRKAGFSSRFIGYVGGERKDFERGEMMNRKGMLGFRDDMVNGHGAVGKVVSVTLPNLIVAGPDNLEKVIVTSTTTIVRRSHDALTVTDIKVDDAIIVLGNPNENGEIVAKLIRIVDAK